MWTAGRVAFYMVNVLAAQIKDRLNETPEDTAHTKRKALKKLRRH